MSPRELTVPSCYVDNQPVSVIDYDLPMQGRWELQSILHSVRLSPSLENSMQLRSGNILMQIAVMQGQVNNIAVIRGFTAVLAASCIALHEPDSLARADTSINSEACDYGMLIARLRVPVFCRTTAQPSAAHTQLRG